MEHQINDDESDPPPQYQFTDDERVLYIVHQASSVVETIPQNTPTIQRTYVDSASLVNALNEAALSTPQNSSPLSLDGSESGSEVHSTTSLNSLPSVSEEPALTLPTLNHLPNASDASTRSGSSTTPQNVDFAPIPSSVPSSTLETGLPGYTAPAPAPTRRAIPHSDLEALKKVERGLTELPKDKAAHIQAMIDQIRKGALHSDPAFHTADKKNSNPLALDYPNDKKNPNQGFSERVLRSQNFVDVLSESPITDFASHRYAYGGTLVNLNLPSMLDIIAHLKLLKAFSVMKENVLRGKGGLLNGDAGEKKWQVFVTNAVRRFIVFVSCLRYVTGPTVPSSFEEKKRYETSSVKDVLISSAMSELLPPLDVLMVWHSFLLNPRSFYDNFMRNDFYKFANLPFPFHMIDVAINNETFEYSPERNLIDGYFRLIHHFTQDNTRTQVLDLLQYDVSIDFIVSRYVVNVACPACKTILVTAPYTNDAKAGFSDKLFAAKYDTKSGNSDFLSEKSGYLLEKSGYLPEKSGYLPEKSGYLPEKSGYLPGKSPGGKLPPSEHLPRGYTCKCNFYNIINHEELRRRQMYIDVKNPAYLPGIYRRFSCVVSHNHLKARDCSKFDEGIKRNFSNIKFDDLRKDRLDKTIFRLAKSERDTFSTGLIFRGYLEMNLVHTTVSPSENSLLQVLEISEDLVGCVVRQGKFIDKMCNIDWLHSPLFRETIVESSVRYSRFFNLLTKFDHKIMLVPTLDIDLVWHTHQLSNHYYFKDCLKSVTSNVVDHDDKVERGRLDNGFLKTSEVYKLHFKEEYSCCMCWYCVASRVKKTSGVSSIFKKQKEVVEVPDLRGKALHNAGPGLTHMSTHNGVELQTKEAISLRTKVQKKYAKKYSADSGIISGEILWMVSERNPDLYVISPVVPIPAHHSDLYSRLCCSLHDFGTNCAGGAARVNGGGGGGDCGYPGGAEDTFRG